MSKYDDLKRDVISGIEDETNEEKLRKSSQTGLFNNIQSELEMIQETLQKEGIHTNVVIEDDKRSLKSENDDKYLLSYYINEQNFLIVSFREDGRFPNESYGFCNSEDKVEDFDRGDENYYDSEDVRYLPITSIIENNFKEVYKKLKSE